MKLNIPIWKISATAGGTALTGAAIVMNAQHVAAVEGWASPLVWAAVIVTGCAAVTPPFAERAGKDGQWLKSALLWAFFGLAVGFSLTASIGRSGGYADHKTASAEHSNTAAQLAKEGYEAAKASHEAECATGRGPRCRAAEDALKAAREALATAAPVQAADPGSERLAAVLGVQEALIALYVPLLLPLGLELGGFIFLAVGLAPAARRREEDEPVAIADQPVARKSASVVAKLQADAIAKPAKSGTAAWYLARLRKDHPALAARVQAGELSVYAGCIEAGLRKPAKASKKWTSPAAYMKLAETV